MFHNGLWSIYGNMRQESPSYQPWKNHILNKLKRFESSKRFLNKDISLAVLAGQLESNTKYLSEIINTHYNVNFNTYINRLRINFIIEKLKTDPKLKSLLAAK